MKITIPFGGQIAELDTDELCLPVTSVDRFCCTFPPPLSHDEIRGKILKSLESYKKLFDNSNVLTVVNDGYRRTPTEQLLSIVWDYLKNGDFIIATGSHRKPTDDELKKIFGGRLEQIRSRLHIHDCYNKSTLVNVGHTSHGTPVFLNNKVIDADLIFTINSVEPHFFAGFTGGRKSLIPGLAGFDTIQANHRFAKDLKSCALNLDDNPLHRDLEEGLKLIGDKTILTIHCVTNRNGEIVDLFIGSLHQAFLQACSSAAESYTFEAPEKYDIVIANCEPPLDANLYQLQKAQEHGGRMVANGGVLITAGACHEGIGSEYFVKLADKYPTPDSVLDRGMNDDSFVIHKLIKTARQLQKFRVYYVTALDEDIIKRLYLNPFNNIKEALNAALEEIGKDAKIAVLDDAGYTVPVIKL